MKEQARIFLSPMLKHTSLTRFSFFFFSAFLTFLSVLDFLPGDFHYVVSTCSFRNSEPHTLIAKELKRIQINMLR